MATNTKNPAEQNLKDNGADGLQLSDAEIAAARKDGAKEDIKDAAKDVHRALTDGNLPGETPKRQWHGSDEIQPWAYLLDLGVEAFEERVSASNKVDPVPDEKVYGLLALERNGQNRTPYVKAAMKRLKLKADELPGGGPSYTNDLTSISDL